MFVNNEDALHLADVPPFKGIRLCFCVEWVQIEAGFYPNGCEKRVHTVAKRVYADESAGSVIRLLTGLATLPIWERGGLIPGYRERCG